MSKSEESFTGKSTAILAELATVLGNMEQEQVSDFCSLFNLNRELFLAGAGRSGLMVKAFAMRLMHLGGKVHLPGDIVAPPIRRDDLLIIASGSGETLSLVGMARKAKDQGAVLALVTANPSSSLGRMADSLVVLSAPTPKGRGETGVASRQPMGSLFEQAAFIFFETVVLELMQNTSQDSGAMFLRHANLE